MMLKTAAPSATPAELEVTVAELEVYVAGFETDKDSNQDVGVGE